MFVSCYIAEKYWVGRSGFFFFYFLFFLRIVMHHNAAKSKNRCYTCINFDIFTLQDNIKHVLKLSVWFKVNSHVSKMHFPLFFSH